MITALYVVAAVIMAVGSLYLAWRNLDVRKFLAGAFMRRDAAHRGQRGEAAGAVAKSLKL